ncbi:uroporphyrinogen-III synthase [Variovorax sp. KK3]|uniref:uroporphyrinogen-III synthase n=1 Tax=Variovorax sp. KK3 TaxID=1855728 RepID=UPI00097C9681|nr:uroporphyrinogen-III synthase [Variovorax sp. KK3]
MPAARVIVTRPVREAARWIELLRGAGVDAQALPLIEIAPVIDTAALEDARRAVSASGYAALMFVSAAAATHFFEGSGPLASGLQARCWATGPGTVRALAQAGVPPTCIDAPGDDAAQFDSEALWARVSAQIGAGVRVLIVRGGDAAGQATGRSWLAREVAAAGGNCDTVVAYRRLAAPLDIPGRALAEQGARGEALWLFTSSEAIGHLRDALPGRDWAAARAIATHPRIAEAARGAGFGTVRTSSPESAALIASIESFA